MSTNANTKKIMIAAGETDQRALEATMLEEDQQQYRNPKPVDGDQIVIDEATRIMQRGNPVEYILDVYNKIHIGDKNIGELLIVSAATSSMPNSSGINPKLSGESGKGKSHSCKTVLHLMPAEYVIKTSLSDKALFYYGAELKSGTVIFSDDVEISPEMQSTIKRSISEYQEGVDHTVVSTKKTLQKMSLPPRINWWLSSVADDLDVQVRNRQIDVGVDDSPATDAAVVQHQLDAAGTGEDEYPVTDEVLVCREIVRDVKGVFATVVIPFNNRIIWTGGANRRNLPMFLDLIKAYTIFSYKQRRTELVEGEMVVYADEADYHKAAALWAPRAKSQTLKLTKNEMMIIDCLASHHLPMDTNEIARATGINYQTVGNLLRGRKDRISSTGGLLNRVKELEREDITVGDAESRIHKTVYSLSDKYSQIDSYNTVVSLTPA